MLGTNLKGTILTVQACLPLLAASGRGRVILTSSITGPVTGYPGWTHYGASKAGQLGFMRTAAIELATDEAAYITGQTIVVDGGQVLPESPEALTSG